MTATAPPELDTALAALADAYRAHQQNAAALAVTWSALRDPAQPWQQTLLRLHDQHTALTATAEQLDTALDAAAREYQATSYDAAPRVRRHLDHATDLGPVTVAFEHLPGPHPFPLADRASFYVVHYPDSTDDVIHQTRNLVERQRRYVRDALAPATP